VTITEVKSGKVFKARPFTAHPGIMPLAILVLRIYRRNLGDYVDESKINEWLVEVLK
jgi:hypothetical protein